MVGIIGDWRENLRIDVHSPDGGVRGRMTTEDEGPTFEFVGNSYAIYDERDLERQLGRLARLMWTAHRRGFAEALAAVTGLPPEENRAAPDAALLRFREERDELTSIGTSTGEVVHVEHRGFRDWHVVIRDGSLDRLSPDEFAAECASAYRAVMSDFRSKIGPLREKHFGRS